MTNFYCILSHHQITNELLAKSVQQRGVNFVGIDEESPLEAFQEDVPALLYRARTSKKARVLEHLLINDKTTTFYADKWRSQLHLDNVIAANIIHQKNHIPIPETIFSLTNNKKTLTDCVEKLGLPIIIKAAGGSHGVGVMKVDSLSSLFSIADYLLASGNAQFILRKFIDTTKSARLIVLGNEVIDSIEYIAPIGDFRSNEGAVPHVEPKQFPTELKMVAVKAVQTLGIEFGGVDILIDDSGKFYVTEVNFPCFFARCQMITSIDISGKMIDHLLTKQQSRHA